MGWIRACAFTPDGQTLAAAAATFGQHHLSGGVRLWAPDAQAQHPLRAVLKDIRADVLARLRELRCDVSPGFDVEVSYVRRPPSTWAPDQRIAIAFVALNVPPCGAGQNAGFGSR